MTQERAFTLSRAAEAEEAAGPVVLLASPAASYVNGAALQVHSGLRSVVRARQAPVTDKPTTR